MSSSLINHRSIASVETLNSQDLTQTYRNHQTSNNDLVLESVDMSIVLSLSLRPEPHDLLMRRLEAKCSFEGPGKSEGGSTGRGSRLVGLCAGQSERLE